VNHQETPHRYDEVCALTVAKPAGKEKKKKNGGACGEVSASAVLPNFSTSPRDRKAVLRGTLTG
jgi:hypothetical protein